MRSFQKGWQNTYLQTKEEPGKVRAIGKGGLMQLVWGAMALFWGACSLSPKDHLGKKTAEPVEMAVQGVEFSLSEASEEDLSLEFAVYQGQSPALWQPKKSYPLESDGIYTLDDLPLGAVRIVVRLLLKEDKLLAKGQLEATLVPGTQRLSPLVLKRVAWIPLDLKVSLLAPRDQLPAEPEEVRVLFESYGCKGCHLAAYASGGVNLADYPYEAAGKPDAFAVMERVVQSVTRSENPMPPSGGPLQPLEVEILKEFLGEFQKGAKLDLPISLTLTLSSSEHRLTTPLEKIDSDYVPVATEVIEGESYDLAIVAIWSDQTYGPFQRSAVFARDEGPLIVEIPLKLPAPRVQIPVPVETP